MRGNIKDSVEKSLKRYLKRSVKITLGLVVAFMISGNIGYAEDINIGDKAYIIQESEEKTGVDEDLNYIANVTNPTSQSTGGIIKLTDGSEIKISTTSGNSINFTVSSTEKEFSRDMYGIVNENISGGFDQDGFFDIESGKDFNLDVYGKHSAYGIRLGGITEKDDKENLISANGDISFDISNVKDETQILGSGPVAPTEPTYGGKISAIDLGANNSLKLDADGKVIIKVKGNDNSFTGIKLTSNASLTIDGAKGIEIEAEISGEKNTNTSSLINNDSGNLTLASEGDILLTLKSDGKANGISKGLSLSYYETKDGKTNYIYEDDSNLSITGNNITLDVTGERDSYGLNFSGKKGEVTDTYEYIVTAENKTSINAKNKVDIKSTSNGTGYAYGINNTLSDVDINGKEINITATGDNAFSRGIFVYDGNVNIGVDNENAVTTDMIKISSESTTNSSRGIDSENGGSVNLQSKNILIESTSEQQNSYGILVTSGSGVTLSGDVLNIDVSGKQIDVNDKKDGVDEDTNLTASKLYDVTQGIRLTGGATLNLDGIRNIDIESSDIAVTANNSDFNFSGTSKFTGNDYLVQGYENNHLLVRPVIQAVDGGNINLSGNTTIYSKTGADSTKDGVKINNVGIYAQSHTDDILEGEDIHSNINVDGNLTVISGFDNFENGYFHPEDIYTEKAKDIIENTDIAIMATSGGEVNVNYKEGINTNEGNVTLIGDILSGREHSIVNIGGDSVTIVGEVLASNGGEINLDMSNGGYFVGRADDYFEVDDPDGIIDSNRFRNDKFSQDIKTNGTLNLTLGKDSKWNVIGQSYVTNLNFNDDYTGYVDLTYSDNSLSVETLSGNGRFLLSLNKGGLHENGNMLYIYNYDDITPAMFKGENEIEGATQYIAFDDESVLQLQNGEEVRFATLGEEAKNKGVYFKLDEGVGKELGVRNLNLELKYEDYVVGDEENTDYNGEETTAEKPGSDVIDENYDNGENWFLTREGEGEINDGGITVIEMAKSNYASAVYMDNLNKRLGDMRFANGKEGFWFRERHDRVGEDGEYRLINYMTQFGYDKPYPMDNGEGTEYRGIAFEYTTGDMEYKNIDGDADVNRQVLWLYDTSIYNNGLYSDYVFRIGRLENEFDIKGRETGAQVTGDYKNLFLGVGAEYGYRFDLTDNLYFEPQIQLQYTYIEDTDYTTNQGTEVNLDEIHSLIGRTGFRLGYDFYVGDKKATLYTKADINHEFLGDQDVEAKDLTGKLDETYHNDNSWIDVGVGGQVAIKEDFNIYMDVERQEGEDKDDQSWQFNLGFRYSF